MTKIYFRADASGSIGYGHFIRTLALADILKVDFDCTFFTCHPTPYQVEEMEKVCQFVSLDEESHFDDFLTYLTGKEIVVLDNYFFTTDYQRAIKGKGCKLVCVDDMHDKHYVADVVINHALTDTSLFEVEPYTKLAIGNNWALLRKPFFEGEMRQKPFTINKIAICFGGVDFLNLTKQCIEKILDQSYIVAITAIIGDKYNDTDIVSSEQVCYKKNLTAKEVALEFESADLAIVSTSGVCLEALACGAIVASGTYMDNQEKIYKNYVQNKLIFPLGNMCQDQTSKLVLADIESMIPNIERLTSIKLTPANYINLFKSLL